MSPILISWLPPLVPSHVAPSHAAWSFSVSFLFLMFSGMTNVVGVAAVLGHEVQILLLGNPDEYRALTEPNLIIHALIKLTKNGGVYAKGIENWQKRTP